ncbi:hypothetical protein ACH5RR_029458 [Cinchona calisaya]|uniref:Pentatricopeptide repeat-containing protein n=1 Tax=Cinchona calisaya TaxID=153742 RepID=A0ABD2YRR1_9GENT
MLERGLKPSEYTYGAVTIEYCKMGELQTAQRYFDEMRKPDLKPNIIVYKNLINRHCKFGNVKEAFAVFRRMLALEALAEIEMYHVLILDLLKYIGIISEFHNRDLILDAFIYIVLIPGEPERANQVLNGILEKCLQPNRVTYSLIINSFCRSGTLTAAFEKLDDMLLRVRSRSAQISVFNTLLHGCSKNGHLQKGLDLLRQMQ